eukprot:scaffold5770_cov388-Prasinococcus_capsulatus_cf.AAC.6
MVASSEALAATFAMQPVGLSSSKPCRRVLRCGGRGSTSKCCPDMETSGGQGRARRAIESIRVEIPLVCLGLRSGASCASHRPISVERMEHKRPQARVRGGRPAPTSGAALHFCAPCCFFGSPSWNSGAVRLAATEETFACHRPARRAYRGAEVKVHARGNGRSRRGGFGVPRRCLANSLVHLLKLCQLALPESKLRRRGRLWRRSNGQ